MSSRLTAVPNPAYECAHEVKRYGTRERVRSLEREHDARKQRDEQRDRNRIDSDLRHLAD
jgi:hypothetical protein